MIAEAATALALLAPTSTLVAAGDVASCRSTGDERTAALVARIPGTVAVLGDIVYERGTAAELRDCYSWRRFRGHTRAALGNHEYGSADARPAKAYFRLPAPGYYSYELGSWHVVVLDSNCRPGGGCEDGSPQQRWLAADLAASTAPCTVGYWHHPRFSSGLHGSDQTMAALWRTFARGGGDVALAGHDHHYERFAPVDSVRSFVVGTGGRSHYPVLRRLARRADGYDWRFVPVVGSPPGDAGSSGCT